MNKKIIDYKVLYSGKIDALTSLINQELLEGYQPYCQLFKATREEVKHNWVGATTQWCQAMVKYEQAPLPTIPI